MKAGQNFKYDLSKAYVSLFTSKIFIKKCQISGTFWPFKGNCTFRSTSGCEFCGWRISNSCRLFPANATWSWWMFCRIWYFQKVISILKFHYTGCLICIWTISWGCLVVTGWLKIKLFHSIKKFMQIPLKVNKVYFFDIKHSLTMTFWIFFKKSKNHAIPMYGL